MNVTTGQIKTQEIKDVEHFSNLRRVPLDQMTKEELEK